MNPDSNVRPSTASTHVFYFLKLQRIKNFLTLIKKTIYYHLQVIALIRWGKSGWLSNAVASLTRFLCPTATAVTMALRTHPTIPRNLTPEQAFESNNGVLHASSLVDLTLSVRYWITTQSILQTFARNWLKAGYNILYYTPFSSEAAWTHVHPDQEITNTIYVQTNNTNTQTVTSQASLMSRSLAPTTPTAHGSPTNIVDPTVQLIALMQQSLQQNATMLAQINYCLSPNKPQTKSLAYQFKPQREGGRHHLNQYITQNSTPRHGLNYSPSVISTTTQIMPRFVQNYRHTHQMALQQVKMIGPILSYFTTQ